VAGRDKDETYWFVLSLRSQLDKARQRRRRWQGRIHLLPRNARDDFVLERDGVPFTSLRQLPRIIGQLLRQVRHGRSSGPYAAGERRQSRH